MNNFVICGNRNDNERMHEVACALTHSCTRSFLVVIYRYYSDRDFWVKKGIPDMFCHRYENAGEVMNKIRENKRAKKLLVIVDNVDFGGLEDFCGEYIVIKTTGRRKELQIQNKTQNKTIQISDIQYKNKVNISPEQVRFASRRYHSIIS